MIIKKEFYSEVTVAILHLWGTGSNERFTPTMIEQLEFLWAHASSSENDYRGGEETYGYADQENIRADLFYISDRWNCAFRIKWLLDGIQNGKF